MKKLYTFLQVLFASMLMVSYTQAQETITAWNFDQQDLTPSTGTGTATAIGGTTTSFSTGNPILYSLNTTDYPLQGMNPGTAGVQFNVSTIGYSNIIINWENRNSYTAANRLRLKYTINGTDWLDFVATGGNAINFNDGSSVGFDTGLYITNAADWFLRSADFSGIDGVEHNQNFAIRLVTDFEELNNYGPTATTYETTGTIRFENVIISGTPIIFPPEITSAEVPLFISGNTPANNRLPFAYRATINHLTPSSTYRYINTAVVTSDPPSSMGSGAIIYANSDGTFARTPVGSFVNTGEYGTFTTDANGSYTGWFLMEPSTNTRFTPGNEIFMKVILNNGNNGTEPITYLTSDEAITVLEFGVGTSINEGTGIRAISAANAKNFIMLYDNEAASGRPLFGTSIESTGIDFSTLPYAEFFKNDVAGTAGSWGGIIPNSNANGVRSIVERSLSDGSVVNSLTSIDGIWSSINTANPIGGLDNVLVLNLIPNSQIITQPANLSAFTYAEGNGPSVSQSYLVSGNELSGSGNIEITSPVAFEISLDGTNWITYLELPYADGVITGQPITINVRLKQELLAGSYNQSISHSGGGAPIAYVTCSGYVSTGLPPVISSEVVPQFIQGINNTNNQRVPYAFYAEISELVPEATYRYYNKAVLSTDAPGEDGSGNTIFVNNDNTFVRSEDASFSSDYGSFVADTNGIYKGWFVLEPSSDARYTPGNNLFMRIMLNDGFDGNFVATRVTTSACAGVINFSTEGDPESGTAIRGLSASTPGNFIYLFDNEEGTGRPKYASFIESTGIDFSTLPYASFYKEFVSGVDGSWGGIIPNLLSSGIKRIEERSITDGSIVNQWSSTDGLWGNVNTQNPTGGDIDELIIDLLPPQIIADPTVLSGFTYLEGEGPSSSQSYLLSANHLIGSGNITIAAPLDYELSLDGLIYTDTVYSAFESGILTGQPVTIYTRLKAELVEGVYNDELICHTGGGASSVNVALNGEVIVESGPTISDVILPLYMEGESGSNSLRVPYAFMATMENLIPEATYRYFNKVVMQSDEPTYTGVGNAILVSDGSFNRTTGNSLALEGQYGEFTTDTSGKYTGWFMIEPTGNERFTPGNELYMRIMLNDGNEGSEIVHYLTTDDFVKVLMFETSYDPTQGTAIKAISEDAAGDFVFLYEELNSTRPIFGTSIESTGIDFELTGLYAPFYTNSVSGVTGSWGGIVPNINPNGVQLIRSYSNQDCSLINTYEMPNGIWGITDTRNPSGGADEILAINLIKIPVENITICDLKVWCNGQSLKIATDSFESYSISLINMQGIELLKDVYSGNKVITLNIPSGMYIARISKDNMIYSTKLFIN